MLPLTEVAAILLPAIAGFLMLADGFRRSSSRLKAAGVVAPAVIGFAIPFLYFARAADGIRAAGDYVCGAFGAVALIFTVGMTLIQLLLSGILFVAFSLVHRSRRRRLQAAR
jgi:heme/copper-type cytochrome/quinol oxidase subunit 4